MKQGLFSWDSIWLTFFGNVYMGWFELLLIYYYYPCPCPKRELHLWRFHGKPWLMYCCCGCAKVQLVSCSLQPVGNQVIVFRGELCWSHKSSDKNLKWCTNLQKCVKSWIFAKKSFYIFPTTKVQINSRSWIIVVFKFQEMLGKNQTAFAAGCRIMSDNRKLNLGRWQASGSSHLSLSIQNPDFGPKKCHVL